MDSGQSRAAQRRAKKKAKRSAPPPPPIATADDVSREKKRKKKKRKEDTTLPPSPSPSRLDDSAATASSESGNGSESHDEWEPPYESFEEPPLHPLEYFHPRNAQHDIAYPSMSRNAMRWLLFPLSPEKFFSSDFEKHPVLITSRKDSPPKVIDSAVVNFVTSEDRTASFINQAAGKKAEKKADLPSADADYFTSIISKEEVFSFLARYSLKYGEEINVTNVVDGKRRTLDILPKKDGEAVVAELNDVKANYESGCSIRLLCPQKYSTSTYRLLSTLEKSMDCMVGANLYLTPRGSQGFAPHYDDVDVFVMQIEGGKRWRVYPPRCKEETLPRASSSDFDVNDVGTPVLDVVLKAGDLLYLPRGWVHQAVTTPDEKHSLHLTVSAMYGWSWADFMEVLMPEALKSAAMASSTSLREGLPRNFMGYMGIVNNNDDAIAAIEKDGAPAFNDYEYELKRDRDAFKELAKKKIARIANSAMNLIDAASDELALKFLSERLPPAFTPFECVGKGDSNDIDDDDDNNDDDVSGGRAEEDIPDLNTGDTNIYLSSRIRLVRDGIARLIVEDDKAVLYHCADNSKTFRENPLSPLEFELDDAPAIEAILTTLSPQWIEVQHLPHPPAEDGDDKIAIAKVLFDEGILMVNNSHLGLKGVNAMDGGM